MPRRRTSEGRSSWFRLLSGLAGWWRETKETIYCIVAMYCQYIAAIIAIYCNILQYIAISAMYCHGAYCNQQYYGAGYVATYVAGGSGAVAAAAAAAAARARGGRAVGACATVRPPHRHKTNLGRPSDPPLCSRRSPRRRAILQTQEYMSM